ncbi:hypothetical protein DPM19_04660 [Actinomadura craniellae]|uniref:Uncharacterized protein n=1 Tax=Actinomadura craniellae TaxID=2231787 RepID=A0A365HB11_9ACTN|nr:hypothetical protein DPM19_04660 [Actinomadura craniellae]
MRLGLDAPARPRLRVEVAGRDRFRVWQETRPVLLGKVARGNYGVHYLRLPGYVPVLPPITAAVARAAPSWPHRYATWLSGGAGPLHTGWWALRPWRPSWAEAVWRHELAADPAGYLDWCAGWQGVLPMRPPPGTEQGRVKAYRKLAREGVLPPLLLWWVSGLDGWLLLDGHARLAAALAEEVLPPALELSLAPSPGQIDERIGHVTRNESVIAARLERDRGAGRPGVDGAARARQWHFGAVYAGVPAERERTRAWPLPGGVPAWAEAAAAAPPGWAADPG